jgi:predicted nucleotidyltransferase
MGCLMYKKRLYAKTKKISKYELMEKFSDKKLEYIKLALLFGSRASEKHHNQSDYDFAIMVDKNVEAPWGYMAKSWNDIGDILDLPECDYDLVDLNEPNKAIIDSIKKNYILLKGNDDELQRLFDKYN